jgi:hypothetical protein
MTKRPFRAAQCWKSDGALSRRHTTRASAKPLIQARLGDRGQRRLAGLRIEISLGRRLPYGVLARAGARRRPRRLQRGRLRRALIWAGLPLCFKRIELTRRMRKGQSKPVNLQGRDKAGRTVRRRIRRDARQRRRAIPTAGRERQGLCDFDARSLGSCNHSEKRGAVQNRPSNDIPCAFTRIRIWLEDYNNPGLQPLRRKRQSIGARRSASQRSFPDHEWTKRGNPAGRGQSQ